MNSQISRQRVFFFEQTNISEEINELEVYKWDQISRRVLKVKIQIKKRNEFLILLSQKGKVLKKVNLLGTQNYLDMFQNLEQIQYLEWYWGYRQIKKYLSKWIATWYGKTIIQVGGYCEDGIKQGFWKQPIKNYSSQAEVYENGEYYNGYRCGKWKYIYLNKIIGGGQYDKGIKTGKWIDLDDVFERNTQIIHKGEYKNGKKHGFWNIGYHKFDPNLSSQIGGGLYDIGIKTGYWFDLDDNFSYEKQVVYAGEYKNGKKVGIWTTSHKESQIQQFSRIGGGQYDQGVKTGKWIDLDDDFYQQKQVIYQGEYENGKKVGEWFINLQRFFTMQNAKYQVAKVVADNIIKELKLVFGLIQMTNLI